MFTHSYSSVNKFETCPRQFENRYILGHKEPPTESTLWGERVHSALEAKAKGDTSPLPEGMTKMEWAVAPALKAKEAGMLVLSEHKVALDRYMKPVAFDFKLAWLRAILDILIISNGHAFVSDYKTGKRRESWQLQLGSLITFYTYPLVQRIEARYLWLKDPVKETRTDKTVYERRQTAHMAGEILPRIVRVENALQTGLFPPKPSGLCRAHCNVLSCEHNGKKS
jgi:CRISPR/Cas system-associated exonuclease Cas4 (RecB family)